MIWNGIIKIWMHSKVEGTFSYLSLKTFHLRVCAKRYAPECVHRGIVCNSGKYLHLRVHQ